MSDENKVSENKEAAQAKALAKDKLLPAALKAYDIDDEFILSSRVDAKIQEVVLVTKGGKKLRWADGKCLDAVDQIGITGVNPKAAKKKPIAGKKG